MKLFFLKYVSMILLFGLAAFAACAGGFALAQAHRENHEYHLITGSDLVETAEYNDSGYLFISGVLSGATAADSTNQIICDHPYLPNNAETNIAVMEKIKSDESLQNQAGAFAVINAYNKLYCSK